MDGRSIHRMDAEDLGGNHVGKGSPDMRNVGMTDGTPGGRGI